MTLLKKAVAELKNRNDAKSEATIHRLYRIEETISRIESKLEAHSQMPDESLRA